MTAPEYVATHAAAFVNPDSYLFWIGTGEDLRLLNPHGAYFKHVTTRIIVNDPSLTSHPDYDYVKNNHPEWVIKDINGDPVPLFGLGEAVDFGNDEYLDWVLDTWMPEQFFDSTDDDEHRVTWYVHDNGSFDAMLSYTPNPADPVSVRYSTDEGVRTAWENMLTRFKARYPHKKMVISTGPVTFVPTATQMTVFQRILSLSDGYFSEGLTNDGVYWDVDSNAGKRVALVTTMELASWLADNNLVFYPNLGLADGVEPTQARTDYGWAFFNLMRKGDLQFFSKVTKDPSESWRPEIYPEMNLYVGEPTEVATQQATNVWRRDFTQAIAYVNLSDASVNITLPIVGRPFKNSLGQTVTSPLTLPSFTGLTVYKTIPGPVASRKKRTSPLPVP